MLQKILKSTTVFILISICNFICIYIFKKKEFSLQWFRNIIITVWTSAENDEPIFKQYINAIVKSGGDAKASCYLKGSVREKWKGI